MTRAGPAPEFDAAFKTRLMDLVRWRRDVRRFRTDPVPQRVLAELIEAVALSPSVGLCQPWRIVDVAGAETRAGVRSNFERANSAALAGYDGERAAHYASLKLSGLDAAPVQWAVHAEMAPAAGHGLGRATMPETTAYSAVCAVMQLWLVARAHGLGVGWVSILDAGALERLLTVPDSWKLVAYLCIGWPEQDDDEPELARAGWEVRATEGPIFLQR